MLGQPGAHEEIIIRQKKKIEQTIDHYATHDEFNRGQTPYGKIKHDTIAGIELRQLEIGIEAELGGYVDVARGQLGRVRWGVVQPVYTGNFPCHSWSFAT